MAVAAQNSSSVVLVVNKSCSRICMYMGDGIKKTETENQSRNEKVDQLSPRAERRGHTLIVACRKMLSNGDNYSGNLIKHQYIASLKLGHPATFA